MGCKLMSSPAEGLAGCSPGDRYRATLCLLRTGVAEPSVLALLMGDDGVLDQLGAHACAALLKHIGYASQSRPSTDWNGLVCALEVRQSGRDADSENGGRDADSEKKK